MHRVIGDWQVHFQADGTLRVWSSVERGSPLAGRWQQRGSEITLSISSAVYTGIFSIDYMVGTSTGVFDENYSWYLVRASQAPSHLRPKTSS
jgi:hypothetical protein